MNNGTHAYYHDNNAHGDDALFIRELGPESVLDVVLDGVSHGDGAFASQFAKKALSLAAITDLKSLSRSLEVANSELYSKTHMHSLTTVAAALKIGNRLFTVNVGDSPGYLVRGKQVIELTTLDRHPTMPNMLTKSLGDPDFRLHTHNLTLMPGDKLVLVTDGISDNIYTQELARTLATENTPDNAISALESLLKERRNTNRGREDVFGHFKWDDATAIIRYFPAT